MKTNYDIIIFGGGCAGLSLARKIIEKKVSNFSILIIERRKEYNDDKTWCFWDKHNSSQKGLIEKRWKTWSFSKGDESYIHSSSEYRYTYIRSINFYKSIKKQISNSRNVHLKLDQNITKVSSFKNYFLVISNNKKYKSKFIIDTIPKNTAFRKDHLLYQSFLGFEIKSNTKLFTQTTNAYLMENMRADKKYFIFDYLLPLTTKSALIEITSFSRKIMPEKKLQTYLHSCIKNLGINNYNLIRKEYGIIPMGYIDKKFLKKNSRYYHAGLVAGAIRPSSGFAFLRIQDWAEKCTNSLINYKHPISHPNDNYIMKFLDTLLLIVLKTNIEKAPYIFYTFAKNISPTSFVKFMTGKVKIYLAFKIIYSMPKKVFLKCLLIK